jgi:aspartyl-tRNA(Asn)/glutamyl-tRNA(Gln) amidotransferase subunit B
MSSYAPTIGIECHVQLKTKTKLFAAVGNDARGAEPNTLVSHICLGMPGALPSLNEKAIELCCRAALVFGVEPQKFFKFDRKHYFYPDLPKGYQITQFSNPIIIGGHVDIPAEAGTKKIGITRAHLEEDAGKTIHPPGKDYSLVDLNRAGTPLLEIVSEPDISSPAEARAFARELYLLMKYASVSDVDMYHGNMRFDVNVSVSNDPKKLGIRTETKNLNSFRSVEKAVEYEIKRQTEVLKKGGKVSQETRGWDEAKQKTTSQRGKEEAHDYRYMPDPDIPPVKLDDKYIEKIKERLPVMPGDIRDDLSRVGVERKRIETLLEYPSFVRSVLAVEKESGGKAALFVANLLVNVWLAQDETAQKNFTFSAKQLVELYDLVQANKLSSTNAKAVFINMQGTDPSKTVEGYAKDKGLIQSSDEGEIEAIVQKVVAANPKAAEDVRNGEMKAIGFLVGQVMKESRGKANPQLAQNLIKRLLNL